jgi:hypothetical protein
MTKSKGPIPKRAPIPENFNSLEEFRAFWDTHSTADYEDLMEDVDFEVDIRSKKIYCAVQRDLFSQLQSHARQQGVSIETLVNLWLREKAMEVARAD